MHRTLARVAAAGAIALSAGAVGYASHEAPSSGVSSAAFGAPSAAGSIRVVYSLDEKRNDREIIALIDGAKKYAYFAVYEFTLPNVADALIRAKRRGVDVRGLLDAGESAKSYMRPIVSRLRSAGISVETERHPTGNGIMHIKALVTDSAYAAGSYNWTRSATDVNDELLEIGTDPSVREAYKKILLRLLDTYAGTTAAMPSGATYDFREAPAHVGEYASVRGTLVRSFASASGTVFLDFCPSYRDCPFSGVIFADDAAKFGDLSRYDGKEVTLTGTISRWQGRAEIKLADPHQLSS